MDTRIHDGILTELSSQRKTHLLQVIYRALSRGNSDQLVIFEREAREFMADQKVENEVNKSDPFHITNEQYRQAADDLKGKDGEIEFDEGAEVSHGDDPGAYVQAWVWVYDRDVRKKLGLPQPICKECGGAIDLERDGSPGVLSHYTEDSEIDHDTNADHAPVPTIEPPEQ